MKALKSSRPHIGIFGKRNVGKSSFINALVGQDISIVSEVAGTTTDPVDKTIEVLGLGPVVLIDTAGLDDEGYLGEKRIEKSYKVLKQIDLAVLVFSDNFFSNFEQKFIRDLQKENLPFIVIHNKEDSSPLDQNSKKKIESEIKKEIFLFTSKNPTTLPKIIEEMKKQIPPSALMNPSLLSDIIKEKDFVLLVTPVDTEAPQGRMILPQVQTIRDVLDQNAIVTLVKETELDFFIEKNKMPIRLVITDSQAFKKVSASVPRNIPLTSFSILFSRLKGDFNRYVEGAFAIDKLKDHDRILILESCSHHSTDDDIGRVKIPRWVREKTKKELHFDVCAGLASLERKIEDYALVIQCGGCMLTKTQVLGRQKEAVEKNIPVTNYGMCIAFTLGIFERAIEPFKNHT